MKEKFIDFLIICFRKIPETFLIAFWKTYFKEEFNDFKNAMYVLGCDVWIYWDTYYAKYRIVEIRTVEPWALESRTEVKNYFLIHEKVKQASDKGWFCFEEKIVK